MRYSVTFELRGALAAAVAVQWTDAAAPAEAGADWRPCLRLPDGRWRLAGHDSAGSAAALWRAPGRLGNVGLRYRLAAGGPWSPVSADRKEIDIVAVSPDDPPPAARAGDWSVPAAFALPGGGRSGAFVLGGVAAAAVAVQWAAAGAGAPAEADWRDAVALADGRWHLGQAVAGNLDGLAVRYRLAADGRWSPASEDRKPLGFADLPVVPVLLAAPALAGSGRIGAAVAALPGLWTGAPVLGFEWCRDGAPIPGATAASYRPGPEDDRTTLSCRVTARTAAGSKLATTAGLAVTWPAPVAVAGVLDEEILDQAPGSFTLEAAPAFRGGGLRFAVAGAGATVDAATGAIAIPTAARLSDTVTVTATNSGGSASLAFAVTVEAEAITAPPALAAADWSIPATAEVAAGRFAGVVEVAAAGPAANAAGLDWSVAATPDAGLALTALGNRRWRMDDPTGAGTNAVAAGATRSGIALRYRLAAGGPWSDWSADRKAFTAPAATAAHWRPVERTPEMLASASQTYGFGYQFCRSHAFCEDEPQYGIAGGDMNGIRLTETTGATWYHPAGSGLRCFGFNSVYVDPRDHNHLLAEGNWAWMSGRTNPSYAGLTGIWRSTDFGATWTLAHAVLNSDKEGYNQSNFCYDPATRAGAVAARTVYKMQRVWATTAAVSDLQLLRSTNGGAAWSVLATLTVASYGEVYALRHHPSDGTLYMASETGLWKSNAAKTAWTRVAGGLPAVKCTAIAIAPTGGGAEMYASTRAAGGASEGVWRSANGGTGWTKIYGPSTSGQYAVRRVEVNWADSPETVYVQLNNGNPGIAVNTSGAGTGGWSHPGLAKAMLGYEADPYHRQLSTKSGSTITNANGYEGLVCPRTPGVCVVNSVGRMFRTLDRGASFADSTWGFTGVNTGATGKPLVVQRPGNPAQIAMAVQDTNLLLSTDSGASWRARQITGFNPTTFGLNMHPQSSQCIGWARSGRLFLGYGNALQQGLCYSDDLGASWTAQTAVSGAGLMFIGCHPTSTPEAIFAADKISTNNGASWTAIPGGGRIEAMHASGQAYIVSGNDVYLSTNWQAGAAGFSKTPFYQAPASLTKYGYLGWVIRAGAAANEIWIKGPGKDLHRVRNTGGSFASAQVQAFPLAGQRDVGTGGFLEVSDIAPDPNDASLVYVTLQNPGGPVVWRGRIDGTSVAWEDVTLNAPKWFDLSIHVLSGGDVVIGGGVGVWMLAPPAGYGVRGPGSVWAGLASPVRR